jgi:bacterial/archaeal transporter family protein
VQLCTRCCPVSNTDSTKLSLLLVAVFATLFLHERPTPREWTGILLVGAGVLVLGFKR